MIFGISMFKNEEDIILPVIKHMLTQVDHVIVADNLSTDRSRELLEPLSKENLTILEDNDPAYYQSKKMTALAMKAMEQGARWVVPFDADEIWYSPFGTISEVLKSHISISHPVATAQLYDHVPTGIDDESEKNPILRMGWRRRTAGALPKVACRTDEHLVIQQGNHSASYNTDYLCHDGALIVRHFPYRSKEQMVRKAITGDESLSHTDLGENSGAHWRGYARIVRDSGADALGEVFSEYFYYENPIEHDDILIYDPAPIGV